MDDDTAAALSALVDLAEAFPGEFRPEFDLGYWAGLAAAEPWYVRFEADLPGGEFTVMAFTAAEALRTAAAEAVRRSTARGG